jgi:hypothetical protein
MSNWSRCAIASVLIAIASSPAYAQPITAKLVMHELHCAKTTGELRLGPIGNPEDEIYVLIKGKKSDGTRIDKRVPGNGVWSMIDKDGPKRKMTNVTLWGGELKNGESVDLFVLFMEEDRKRFDAYTKQFDQMLDSQRFASMAKAVGGGGKKDDATEDIIREILKELIKLVTREIENDTDDVPGAVRVRMWNENGNIRSSWQAYDSSEEVKDKRRDKNWSASSTFNLKGHGTLYQCTVEATSLPTFVIEKLEDNGPQRGGNKVLTFNEVNIRTSADDEPWSGYACVNGQREGVVSTKQDLRHRKQWHTARLVIEKVRGQPVDEVHSGDEVHIRTSLDCEGWSGYIRANPETGALQFVKKAEGLTPTVWVVEKKGGGPIQEGDEVMIRTSDDGKGWSGYFDITGRKLHTRKKNGHSPVDP